MPDLLRLTSYHEAGHQAMRLRLGLRPTWMKARADGRGFTQGSLEPVLPYDDVRLTLAGPVAEARKRYGVCAAFIDVDGCRGADFDKVRDGLRYLDDLVSLADVNAALRVWWEKTVIGVDAIWPLVKALAVPLRQRGRLSADDVALIVARYDRRWPTWRTEG
jgi:hypothetical protein